MDRLEGFSEGFDKRRLSKTEIRTTSSTGGQKGVKSQDFSLIPIGPLTRLAEHLHKGAKKYAPHNWRRGYEFSKGYSAGMRHFTAWWSGEDYDNCPENGDGCSDVDIHGNPFPRTETTCYNHTGSHHLDGLMFHAFTLRELVETHPEFDDRYKP